VYEFDVVVCCGVCECDLSSECCCRVLQGVAESCSVLQHVAVYMNSTLQCVAVYVNVTCLQSVVAGYCRVLQSLAVCCSMLQCV